MKVNDISFLTDKQKRKLIGSGIYELSGNRLDNLQTILQVGETQIDHKEYAPLMLAIQSLGIAVIVNRGLLTTYITVCDKDQIAENMAMLLIRQNEIANGKEKVLSESARVKLAIESEAKEIKIDLDFVKEIADVAKTYDLNNVHTSIMVSELFDKLLKRNGIKRIKSDRVEVQQIVLNRLTNNWLYRILTSQ